MDVEVDPCIDENSASNLNYSPSFTEAPSIKTFVERCVPIFLPPGRDESSLSQFFPTRILKRKRATRPGRSAFYMSKMRAHVAADARVTSGALYL